MLSSVSHQCHFVIGSLYRNISFPFETDLLLVDQRIKFYSQNTNLLPPKPKSTFRHLKQGIQDFH